MTKLSKGKPQGTGLGTALSKYSLPTMNTINTQNQNSYGGNTSKNFSSLDHIQNTANTQALPSVQRYFVSVTKFFN